MEAVVLIYLVSGVFSGELLAMPKGLGFGVWGRLDIPRLWRLSQVWGSCLGFRVWGLGFGVWGNF